MASPTVVGTATAAATSATGHNLTLTADAGTASGDLLVVAVVSRVGTNTISAPDGTWTAVPSSAVATGTTSSQLTAKAFTRPATAADAGASFVFSTNPGSAELAGAVATIRGADATTPIDVTIGVNSSSTANVSNPGCTTVTDGCLVIAIDMVNSDASGNLTVSSPFTELAEAHCPAGTSSPVGVEIASWTQTTHGATGTVTWSSDAGANKSINYSIAFRPAATSGGGSASVSESVPVSAAFTRAQGAQSRTVSFTAAVSAVFARAASKARTLADTVSIGVAIARAQGSQTRTMADSVAVSATLARSTSQQRTVAESVPVVVSFAGSSATGGAITASLPISTGVARSYAGARSSGVTVGTLVAFSGAQSAQSRDAAASVPISTGASAVFISVNALRIRAVQAGSPMTRSAAGSARTRATTGAPMARVAAGPVTTSR